MIQVTQLGDSMIEIRLDDGGVNVLNAERAQALREVFEKNQDCAVLITGNGRAFSAGVDLAPILAGDVGYISGFLLELEKLVMGIFQHPRPVVAALNGHTLAGGCLIGLAADLRLMSHGLIGVTELLVGVAFPPGALAIVEATAGTAASDLVLRGRRLDPAAAQAVGFVHEVIEADQLQERALAELKQLASIPASVYALTKEQLHRETVARTARDIELDRQRVVDCWTSEPVQQSIRAYLAAMKARATS